MGMGRETSHARVCQAAFSIRLGQATAAEYISRRRRHPSLDPGDGAGKPRLGDRRIKGELLKLGIKAHGRARLCMPSSTISPTRRTYENRPNGGYPRAASVATVKAWNNPRCTSAGLARRHRMSFTISLPISQLTSPGPVSSRPTTSDSCRSKHPRSSRCRHHLHKYRNHTHVIAAMGGPVEGHGSRAPEYVRVRNHGNGARNPALNGED